MTKELSTLGRSVIFSLVLIGIAELAVRIIDAPRLWALITTFIVGYALVALARTVQHRRVTRTSRRAAPDGPPRR